MKTNTFIRLIDAGYGSSRKAPLPGIETESAPLMPDTGEYCVALRRISALGSGGPAGRRVPDEIFLHLFTYELLERMRDQARHHQGGKAKNLVLPFWPECLFRAAGLPVHSTKEIQTFFPPAKQTYYARRPEKVIAQEARRVMGCTRFDPGAYIEAIEATAARNGWMIIEEMD